MHVFVTGASGYIGNAVARAFSRSGHKVFGLVRSEKSAQEIQKSEIHPLIGTFENPPSIHPEAIVHCAYESGDKEMVAVNALLKLKPKIFVYTSGVWVYGNTKHADETTPPAPLSIAQYRLPVEEKVLQHNGIIIRPAHVYGYDRGLFAMIFETATIVGNGENHWSIVHVEDLAALYVLAVEKKLTKTILNGTETSVKMKTVAEAIGKVSQSKVRYLPIPEAQKLYGSLTEGLAVDQQNISSQKAAELLSWHPRHNNFISEIALYWNAWKRF